MAERTAAATVTAAPPVRVRPPVVLDTVEDLDVLDSPGRPLSPEVQLEMAIRLGHDVSRVRIHTDETAADLADAMDAEAVTVGRDVYFGRGRFTDEVLTHELAHAVGGARDAVGELSARSAGEPDPPVAQDAPVAAPEPPSDQVERLATPRGARRSPAVPDRVSAGEALLRLVVRMLDRDSTDRGGRLRAVLGRLAAPVREALVERVREDRGGVTFAGLSELLGGRAPADGGSDPESPPPDTASPDTASPDTASSDAAGSLDPASPDTARSSDTATATRPEGVPSDARLRAGEQTAAPTAGEETAAETAQAATGSGPRPASGDVDPAALERAAAEGEETAETEAGPAVGSLEPTEEPAGTEPVAPVTAGGPPVPQAAAPDAAAGAAGGAPSVPEAVGGAPAGLDAALAAEPGAAGPPTGEGPADASPVSGTEPEAGALAAPESATAGPATSGPAASEPAAPESAASEPATSEPAAPEPATAEPATSEPATSEPASASAASEPAAFAPVASESATEDPAESPALPEPPGPGSGPTASAGGGAELEDQEIRLPESALGGQDQQADQETAATGGATAEDPTGSGFPNTEAAPEAVQPEAVQPQAIRSTATEPAAMQPAGTEPTAIEPTAMQPAGAETTGAETTSAETTSAETTSAETTSAETTSAETAGVIGALPGGEGVLEDPVVPAGGGGGGGAPIPERPRPEPPDVSAMDPGAALGAVGALPVTLLAGSLSGVRGSATRAVGEKSAALASSPPAVARPSGVPADRDASLPPAPLPPLPKGPDLAVRAVSPGAAAPLPEPAAPPPAPAPAVAGVPEPRAGGDTPITAEDAAQAQAAVQALPTTDAALRVDAGPVPELALTGDIDPALVRDQAAEVRSTGAAAGAQGLGEARAPMGENDVFPQVPEETLTAEIGEVPPPQQAEAPAAVDTGDVPAEAVDAVAAEQSGAEIAGATRDQAGALDTARADHDSSVEKARADTDKEINDEVARNATDQRDTRAGVRAEVGEARRDWVGEQQALTTESATVADRAQADASAAIGTARTDAARSAAGEIRTGNAAIAKERAEAERKAREERAKAEKESSGGGFFSWLGSKVKSFFDGVRKAIGAAFDLARKAVDVAIRAAQQLAVAAVEVGRRAALAAIELGGKALMAAGDIVLAGFPKAREKFRQKITEKVDAAKKRVDALADALKAGVKKLLDLLGSVLKGALSLLEKLYTAAVDAVAATVNGVLKAAQAWITALAEFATIAADIAAGPGHWLRNLGASLMDGVRNHVWPALVKAVKDWFKAKVEEVVGVGKTVLEILRKGGVTFAKIVTMAWTAIKESLPGILIQILIEKLIAMLIPAGGALALIIDGIRAAWASASRILAAFQKFVVFLKAVRAGGAGPKFGDLVGAAAVAVIEFVANFVLVRLKGAGAKVGGTLSRLAAKLTKVVKKVAGVARRGAVAAARVVKKAAVAGARTIKRGVAAVKRGAAAVGRGAAKVVRKGAAKVAAVAGKGVQKVKQGYAKAKQKLFGKPKPKVTLEERISRTEQKLTQLLRRGINRLSLWAWTKWLSWKYRWKRLAIKRVGPHDFSIRGDINPSDLFLADFKSTAIAGNDFVRLVQAGEKLDVAKERRGKEWWNYEKKASSTIVLPGLRRTFGAGGAFRFAPTFKGDRRKPATASRIPYDVNKRNARSGSPLGSDEPDAQTLVPASAVAGAGVSTTPSGAPVTGDVLYAFEMTLQANFLRGAGEIKADKRLQNWRTPRQLFDQYPTANTIIYTVITVARPDREMERYLSAQQQEIAASKPGKNLYLVWRVVGK